MQKTEKFTLLIVDDELNFLEATAAVLEVKGYRVITAKNSAEGLKAAAKYLPNLILLDIRMPDLDGWQTLAAIRASAKIKHIPVIMLTTLNQIGDITRSFDIGANGYLSKPVNTQRLYTKVEEHLLRKEK
ncbi:two-component system response regulator [Elusimicrobiota bacterium]